MWRQGLYLGGVFLLGVLSIGAWAAAADAAPDLAVARPAEALALTAALTCALVARPRLALLLAGAAIAGHSLVGAELTPAASMLSYGAVVVGALLGGSPTVAMRGRRRAALASTLAILGASLALAGAGTALEGTGAAAFAWALPAGLLVLGSWDPRLAAAATTLVLARLAASGFGELGAALDALHHDSQRELLARWILMGTATPAAWFATNRYVRRLSRL